MKRLAGIILLMLCLTGSLCASAEGDWADLYALSVENAIEYGDRLVMMHNGGIILDISGEEKKQLTVEKQL